MEEDNPKESKVLGKSIKFCKIIIIPIILLATLYIYSVKTTDILYISNPQRMVCLNLEIIEKPKIVNRSKLEEIRENLETMKENELKKMQEEKEKLANLELTNRSNDEDLAGGALFKITFYTLSVASCGKTRSHPQYGITATGYSLVGKDSRSKVISVDPRIIPLKSKVSLVFKNENFSFLNGEYYARDTGGAIKGSHIDLFLGEDCDSLARKYGVQYGYLQVLK